MELKRVTPDDIILLQTIGRQTFAETFSDTNTEEDMAKYLAENFSRERLAAEIDDANSLFFFTLDGGQVIGYLKVNMRESQTELKDSQGLEIERIYTLKAYHGKGVGQLLYTEAIRIARENNLRYVWLGVWEKNERAISFYRKNGFVAFDKHIFRLGDDEQTDIMMRLELTIGINPETCIKCGHCVRVCPAHIFYQETPHGQVRLQNIASCIRCGHCVGVCPTSSVLHADFPPEKVHRIDRKLLPTPEQVMLLCKTRRSNRALSSQPIPGEMLDQIIEAAHTAPTGSNVQQVSFTLVTDPAKVRKVIELTMNVFSGMLDALRAQPQSEATDRMIGYMTHLTDAYAAGTDPILRGAETLLLFHTPAQLSFGYADANLAYQNGSLMAEALGVSQFFTGYLCTAIKQDNTESITKYLGIDGIVHAGMALGMPEFRFLNYVDRDEAKVNRF